MTNSCMSTSLLLVCICFLNGDSSSAYNVTPVSNGNSPMSVPTSTTNNYTSPDNSTNATTVSVINSSMSVSTSTTNNSTPQVPDNSTNKTAVSGNSSSMSVPTSTTNISTPQVTDNSTNTTAVSGNSSSMSVPTDNPTSGGIPSVTPSTGTDGHKEGLSEEGQLSIIVVCVIVGTSVIIVGVAYLSCYFNKQKTLTYEQRNTVAHMNGTVPKLSPIENGDVEMNNLPGGDTPSVSNHNPSPHPSV